MRKLVYLIVVIVALGLIVSGCGLLTVPPSEESDAITKGGKYAKCTTITSGDLIYSNPKHYLYGEPLTTGYDVFGYNYQAHMFNGWYENYTPTQAPVEEGDTWLVMKWNDAWLSNKDCDNDDSLDRPSNYIGSGAWCTNHQSGEYVEDGKTCKWNYFVKIVAAPADAELVEDIWFDADGTEIGPEIWGAFAIVQQVENDTCAGIHGAQYISPVGPGLGKF